MGKHCTHNEARPVLTIGKCEVWGGRESQVMPMADQFDCIVSLLGTVKRTDQKFTLSRGSRRLFRHLAAYQQRRNNLLCIDWPDMQAPRLDRGFWEALAADLAGIAGKAAIFCMGSHGRTGTALAALSQVSNYAPAMEQGDVIAWLREEYCQSAVETSGQVDYLTRVLGMKTTAKGSSTGGHMWAQGGAISSFLDETGVDRRMLLDDEHESFRDA